MGGQAFPVPRSGCRVGFDLGTAGAQEISESSRLPNGLRLDGGMTKLRPVAAGRIIDTDYASEALTQPLRSRFSRTPWRASDIARPSPCGVREHTQYYLPRHLRSCHMCPGICGPLYQVENYSLFDSHCHLLIIAVVHSYPIDEVLFRQPKSMRKAILMKSRGGTATGMLFSGY